MQLSAGNGQVTRNTYDALGRLTYRALHHHAPITTGNKQAEFSWQHDAIGNVKQQNEVWSGADARTRITVMTYDGNNRLLTEEVAETGAKLIMTTYGYDNGNNRTSKVVAATGEGTLNTELGHWSYEFNDANQLLRTDKRDSAEGAVVAGASYLYDANGNRASRVNDGTGSLDSRTTNYVWDAENFLVGVNQGDGSSAYSYAYDYRTRRITTNKAAAGSEPAQSTAIVFSGGLSVSEYEDGATTPNVHYVRGPDMGGGVGGMLYSVRGNTAKYSLSNGRGDVVAQSDATATLTWTASYEAFGKRTKETGTNLDKQRANSKNEDPTGLLNEGHRYRDLESGTFISRDPAGFVDGPNVYAYVKQNPWTAFDPHGLAEKGSEWHHRFPQKFRKEFMERMEIDVDESRSGVALSSKDHRALHDKKSFPFGSGKDVYTEKWQGFFDDLNKEEASKGALTMSARREKAFAFLEKIENDSKLGFKDVLSRGAQMPEGLHYIKDDWKGFSAEQKSSIFKTAWGAKAREAIPPTFLGKVGKGIKYSIKGLGIVGTALTVIHVGQVAYAEGADAGAKAAAMDITGASTVEDIVGSFAEETIAPGIYGRTMDAASKFDDAVKYGTPLLPR